MRVGEAWAMFAVVTLGPIGAGAAWAQTTPAAPPAIAPPAAPLVPPTIAPPAAPPVPSAITLPAASPAPPAVALPAAPSAPPAIAPPAVAPPTAPSALTTVATPAALPAPPAAKVDGEPPPRPPLPPEPPPVPLPWERHIEAGADAIFAARPTSSAVHLQANVGFGAHLNWELRSHLRFTFYVEAVRHPLTFDARALGQPGTITSPAVSSYMFGARFSPTLPLTPRLRAWLTAGAGWGRFEYPRMTAQDPGQAAFMIPERSAYIVEVPLGLGIAFDIIPRWLSIQAELTGAFMVGHQGNAFELGQAIDAAGKKRTIGMLPQLDASIVQTIGLSLLL